VEIKALKKRIIPKFDIIHINNPYEIGKILAGVSLEHCLGTLPISWSVPAARPRLGQFSCPKPSGKFEN
jgi:hypothetical protein